MQHTHIINVCLVNANVIEINLDSVFNTCIIHVCLDLAFSERYRDLIEAADTISAMKSSAENVSVCMCVCVCMHCVCMCTCVCACVHACMHALCVCVYIKYL